MHLINPDLENRAFEVNVNLSKPVIDENVLQSLVYLIAYDENSELFRFALADSEGRLQVSSGATKADTVVNGAITVDTTAELIVNTNPSRKFLEIINNSANDLYLGFDTGVTIANGFPVPSGAVWYTEIYLGAIYMIGSVAGSDVRYIDMS